MESADLALKATMPLTPSPLHLKACAGAELPGSRSFLRAADMERTEEGWKEALETLCYTDFGFTCRRLGPDL